VHGNDDSSSEEEDDAFAALSQSSIKRRKVTHTDAKHARERAETQPSKSNSVLPVSLTSSMKRHHKPSEDRRAKMEALLQELEEEKKRAPRFVPDKKGSFVDASEEHLTTNIFVVSPGRIEKAGDIFPWKQQ
jgi:uncharacterized sporulation protein YeaH/YhbH (DUF444 family)